MRLLESYCSYDVRKRHFGFIPCGRTLAPWPSHREFSFRKRKIPLAKEKILRKFPLAKLLDSAVYTHSNAISTQTNNIGSSYNDMVSLHATLYVIIVLKSLSIVTDSQLAIHPFPIHPFPIETDLHAPSTKAP